MTQDELDNYFKYHPPTPDQVEKYNRLRDKGKELAQLIMNITPLSADHMAAIRKVREAVMTASAAIACHRPGDRK